LNYFDSPEGRAYYTRPMPPAPADHIDAFLLASRGAALDRSFVLGDLPRVAEAGASDGKISAQLRFLKVDSHPAVDGNLTGSLLMTCQRCWGDVTVEVAEPFELVIVPSEKEAERVPEQYDAVITDALHLDVRALIEEQVLLALPLVARHADEQCAPIELPPEVGKPVAPSSEQQQTPFANLRDLLGKS
jgi:uncharacterized protein